MASRLGPDLTTMMIGGDADSVVIGLEPGNVCDREL